eukprot:scaffold185_cov64-Phaeocystis_antarctica.AAC.4
MMTMRSNVTRRRERAAAWAEAPGRARRGCDASCLGVEAWRGILAVAEATQSTAAPERASRARHCGRCLSGAHGASGALEARLLALVGLVRAGLALVARALAGAWLGSAGRTFPAVGWVGAPRNRVGLPQSARLAGRAAILTAVWVERAGGARCERLPQARRSFCRARATAGTVAAPDRADVLTQFARRARQAACASLVRVVGPGCARNAACLQQAGDADGEVCTGSTQEWLNACIRAEFAPAVALATARGLGLDRFVAIVASRALVRAAGEVHWGHDQRRGWNPQAERAVDDGVRT